MRARHFFSCFPTPNAISGLAFVKPLPSSSFCLNAICSVWALCSNDKKSFWIELIAASKFLAGCNNDSYTNISIL